MTATDKIMQGLEITPREREGKIELVVVSPETDARATFWLSDVVCDLLDAVGRAQDAGTFEAEKPRFEAMLDDAFEMLSALHSAVHNSSKIRVSGTFTASGTESTDP
ncbi:MAG: hypothetical protein EOM91_21360 [Sphingobacteriia bacterium]|nr:hypothetical protein [Sphingobacteriia bacterium]